MKIVVPSHKRANDVLTKKAVSNIIVCVPENQVSEYHRHNDDIEIAGHPNSIVGISKKRQWILDRFGDVFMLDDDIIALRRTYLAPKQKMPKFTKDDVYNIIMDTYHSVKEFGRFKMFGFSKTPSPLHYSEPKPIALTGFIQGCAQGFIKNDDLQFPSIDTMTGEDDFMCLLNAYFNRMIYIDKRFFFQFQTNNYNVGGCGDFRNYEAEKKSYLHIKKNFGGAVTLDDVKNEIKWRCKIPF